MTIPHGRLWFSVLLLVALTGCGGDSGPPRAAVKGKVTFDGEPIAQGVIVFLPAEGTAGPTSGVEIRDGQYELPAEQGPVVGANRVEITASKTIEGKTPQAVAISGATAGPSAMPSGPPVTMYIPQKYNRDSTLKADIKPGENSFDFPLTSK